MLSSWSDSSDPNGSSGNGKPRNGSGTCTPRLGRPAIGPGSRPGFTPTLSGSVRYVFPEVVITAEGRISVPTFLARITRTNLCVRLKLAPEPPSWYDICVLWDLLSTSKSDEEGNWICASSAAPDATMVRWKESSSPT